MQEFFKSLFRGLHVPTLAEKEMAYLNDANDRYDLEQRQRQIDHGLFKDRWSFMQGQY